MSQKNRDEHHRWRNKTVAFRMSPEEARLLDMLVETSGLTKQDYLIQRVLNREIQVQPSPRLYKKLRTYLLEVKETLERLMDGASWEEIPSAQDLPDMIAHLNHTLGGLKGEEETWTFTTQKK